MVYKDWAVMLQVNKHEIPDNVKFIQLTYSDDWSYIKRLIALVATCSNQGC